MAATAEFEPRRRRCVDESDNERMKADDPNIHWVEEPKLGLAGKMYLPLFVAGLDDDGASTWSAAR